MPTVTGAIGRPDKNRAHKQTRTQSTATRARCVQEITRVLPIKLGYSGVESRRMHQAAAAHAIRRAIVPSTPAGCDSELETDNSIAIILSRDSNASEQV